ncbi:Gfo/Idh/MocA family oxidoreductase [Enterovibrio sp. ZSDZ35]|uniref:Gfo/Idh/MocA family oxidoreductase n=1 Tax=Enterovibrio qingdaonensis TaxID=2899818 RepID=A0ABT5QGV7_9GAMM|nr:Gfo/Idh/MocA family oxidoreductase [Enterovibrio sp. ZSDZ35]MDD1780187.1 Gfo/Idh/MocA family oxidoreductase [Enterovibrio sp. ZSDZ35]
MAVHGLVRYGILGCGMMGQEHIRNIQLLDNAEVTVLADPNIQMRTLAHQLVPTARIVDGIDALLNSDDIDALVIATPNYQHVEQLLTLIECLSSAGQPLPILIEKPICTRLEEVSLLLDAANNYDAPIWVAMEYRYMPPVSQLLSLIRQGEIGRGHLFSIREHRFPFLEKVNDWNRFNRKTGGTLVEKCCHFFDLMRLMTEANAVRVYASGSQAVNHLDETYDGETPDILDNAFVTVEFDNGARANLELCMFAEGATYQEEISAIGDQGKVECLVPGPDRFWPKETLGNAPVAKVISSPRFPKGPRSVEVPVDPTLLEAGDHNGSTFYQHQKFQCAIWGEQTVEVSLVDGLKAVVIGLAAQASIKEKRVIALKENGLLF